MVVFCRSSSQCISHCSAPGDFLEMSYDMIDTLQKACVIVEMKIGLEK